MYKPMDYLANNDWFNMQVFATFANSKGLATLKAISWFYFRNKPVFQCLPYGKQRTLR